MVTEIYHGSNMVVENPSVRIAGFYKDFGYGFYCTKFEKQARKWATTKRPNHIVNVYNYESPKDLSVKSFDEMSEEWLDFVVACRCGVEHCFDIVEGPMADDTIWNYVEDFVDGSISREAFWVLVKFKMPTHQIVFCSDRALSCISFSKYYEL